MLAENITRAFWPAWSVLFVLLAPVLFGWHDLVAREWAYVVGAVGGLAFLVALVWGARRFAVPQEQAAVDRVDAALPGRPIAAITDTQAIGSGDPASEAVWQAHLARMQERTQNAAPVAPDLRVSDRDPYGLRFIALLFFMVALLFGTLFRIGTAPAPVAPEALATGPVWEGWVEPPAYTGKPSIYLNDVPAGGLYVPEGSQITLRLYGEVDALTVTETVSGTAPVEGEEAPTGQYQFTAEQDGNLTIAGEGGAEWGFVVVKDQPPLVELTGPIEADALGEMSQPFLAMDDYGVVSGTATIALDLDAVDRRYGLAVEPEGIEPLVLDLPMPFTGDRTDFEEIIIDDFSQHPLANLPVTMMLTVTDAAGQTFSSEPEPMVLPGRRFFQPFAKAIIEQRRDLMWSLENTRRISQVMKAISHRPEGLFSNEVTFLRMRTIMRRIDNFVGEEMPEEARAEFVEALWDLAIQLEDGTLADARERLRRAQERLSEAMRNGASDAEIAELMQELRDATDDYLDLLAQEMEPEDGDGTDQADSGQQGQEYGQSELDAIMDRIQELMEEGRMAEAQALMEEYNRLLENLRMTQNQGGGSGEGRQTPEQQAMEDLQDNIEDQEQLTDDAFRRLQELTNPDRRRRDRPEDFAQNQQGEQGEQGQQAQQGQQGQPGQQQGQQQGQGQPNGEGQQGQQPGQSNQQGQSGNEGEEGQSGGGQGEITEEQLAERQGILRDGLNRLRESLPGLSGEAGERAENSLGRAEGAMDRAEEALRGGDIAGAIQDQSEALDALRDGLRNLDRAFAENQQGEPGQADGETATGQAQNSQDPLGRELGNGPGGFGTEQGLLQGPDVYRRAEELLNELRRRSADQERPEVEKNYLKRLLEQF